MALTPRRHRVGGTSADATLSQGEDNAAFWAPAETLWTYDAKTGGSRVTDLAEDAAGASPITEVTSDSTGQVPEIYTPAGVTELWVSSSSGESPETNPRVLLSANDLAEDINALDAAIEDIEVAAGVQTVNGVEPVSGNVDLIPEDIDAAGAAVVDGLLSRSVTVTVVQSGAGYPPRPSYANYVHWVGSLDPAAASVDGDEWHYPATGGS